MRALMETTATRKRIGPPFFLATAIIAGFTSQEAVLPPPGLVMVQVPAHLPMPFRCAALLAGYCLVSLPLGFLFMQFKHLGVIIAWVLSLCVV